MSGNEPSGNAQPVLVVRFEGWTLDLLARTLHGPCGAPVRLSEGEYRLLHALASHPQHPLDRDQLLAYSRGFYSDRYCRAIDIQISRLRRKLGRVGGTGLIATVPGKGYKFAAPVRFG